MKYLVKLETVIKADDRKQAWRIAQEIMDKRIGEEVFVISVNATPLPEESIALNEGYDHD